MAPSKFTFDFAGRNSKDMGIYATSYDFVIPPKREKRQPITFRHGSYDYGVSYYDDRLLTLRCFWLNDKIINISRADMREISLWLSRRGQIILDIEPDKYYLGELYEPTELIMRYNRALEDGATMTGGFELSFLCDPFAYGKQVIMPIVTGNNAVEYGGTAETPTLISIRNPNSYPVQGIRLTTVSIIT